MKLQVPFNMPYVRWANIIISIMISTLLILGPFLDLGLIGLGIILVGGILKEYLYDKPKNNNKFNVVNVVFTMIVPTLIVILKNIL